MFQTRCFPFLSPKTHCSRLVPGRAMSQNTHSVRDGSNILSCTPSSSLLLLFYSPSSSPVSFGHGSSVRNLSLEPAPLVFHSFEHYSFVIADRHFTLFTITVVYMHFRRITTHSAQRPTNKSTWRGIPSLIEKSKSGISAIYTQLHSPHLATHPHSR